MRLLSLGISTILLIKLLNKMHLAFCTPLPLREHEKAWCSLFTLSIYDCVKISLLFDQCEPSLSYIKTVLLNQELISDINFPVTGQFKLFEQGLKPIIEILYLGV